MMPYDSGYHLSLTYVYISVLYINHIIEVDLKSLVTCEHVLQSAVQVFIKGYILLDYQARNEIKRLTVCRPQPSAGVKVECR